MAGEVNQNDLLKRLIATPGLEQAFNEHAGDQTTYGNPQLPKGIERGIARLKEVKLGVYETGEHKGKLYFMGQGIVKSPEVFKGVSIAGLHTKIGPEPICDTPKSGGKYKTVSEHFGRVLNWLRGLGAETKGKTLKDLPAIFAVLNKTKPHFYFRTWAGPEETLEQRGNAFVVLRDGKVYRQYPTKAAAEMNHKGLGKEPQVMHEWNGLAKVEARQQGDGVTTAMNAVDEQTAPDTPDTSETEPHYEEPTPGDDNGVDSANEAYAAYSDQGDIDELASLAEQGNEQASATLQEYARGFGVTDEQMNQCGDHYAIVTLVKETEGWQSGNTTNQTESESDQSEDSTGEDSGDTDNADEPQPEPESNPEPEIAPTPVPAIKPNPKAPVSPKTTTPKPASPKPVPVRTTPPPAKKPEKGRVQKFEIASQNGTPVRLVEGEIVFVDEAGKKVNIKNLEDNKVHRGIPWASLK